MNILENLLKRKQGFVQSDPRGAYPQVADYLRNGLPDEPQLPQILPLSNMPKPEEVAQRLPEIKPPERSAPIGYVEPPLPVIKPTVTDVTKAFTPNAGSYVEPPLPVIEPVADAARAFTPQAIDPPEITPVNNSGGYAEPPLPEITPLESMQAERDKLLNARNEKWSMGEKILSGVLGFLDRGGVGALRAATDRNYLTRMNNAPKIAQADQRISNQQQIEKFKSDQASARINQELNEARKADIPLERQLKQDLLDERKADRIRKTEDRYSRLQTSRMNAVAGMFKNIPAFNPDDPQFAELKQALGDINLPITRKDAKKNVKLIQDQRSGAWSVVLTDPVNGTQETRDVKSADGTGVLKTTPTVVMQGEYGLTRQDDQQAFTAQQNQLNRDQQIRLTNLQSELKLKLEAAKSAQRAADDEKDFERKKALQDRANEFKKTLKEADNAFRLALKGGN